MRRARPAAGFTYLTILFVVAIMGVGLALAGHAERHLLANRVEEVGVGPADVGVG